MDEWVVPNASSAVYQNILALGVNREPVFIESNCINRIGEKHNILMCNEPRRLVPTLKTSNNLIEVK